MPSPPITTMPRSTIKMRGNIATPSITSEPAMRRKQALKHGEHALFHANQAAMHHMEHYGSHLSAELA
jgi:hypothetical protein